MSASKNAKATSLRNFLTVVLILAIAGAAAGFYFGLQQIQAFATETNERLVDAEASGDQIDQLRELQASLQASDSLVQKAQNVFVTQEAFQSQAIRDLQRYASEAGIDIDGTEFPEAIENPEQAPSANAGRIIEVRLASPVSYERLIRFIQLVEGNIPKMQIDTLEITRPDSPSGDQVNVEPILIRMAVR